MQKGDTQSFSFPSVDGQKLFKVKVGVVCTSMEKKIKPVFDNKIGVFVDLGLKQNCQDGDGIVRGFTLHILRASITSIEKRYDSCNIKQQLFAHLFGALLLSFHGQLNVTTAC